MRLLPRKYSQVFACMLIMLMVLTNPAFIAAAYAAGSDDSKDQSVITLDKSKLEEVNAASDNNTDKYKELTDRQRFTRFGNELLSYYLQNGKSRGPEWLKTTSINFSFTDDHKPVYSFETLQPFGKLKEKGQLWFWQGRYAHSGDETSTANLGFGWRKLSADKSSMIGLNTFYDYGFKYDLARIGMGVEYVNKLAEYRCNFYHPVSGDRQTGGDYLTNGIQYSYIRAVSGMDFELGTSLENARWLNFYLNGYYYDNQYNDDEKGFKLRTTMQLTPRFLLELGYKDSNVTNEPYVQFKYQLADAFGPSLSGKHQPKDNDISYKLLQKVERENDIKTEKFTKFVPYTGSIRTHVTTNSGAALQFAIVQAYQNGSPVGSAATTGPDGDAILSGLSSGSAGTEYTVKASYFGYNSDERTVKVEKEQIATAAVKVQIDGGSASITVLNGQSQPISGASVTATLVTSAQAERSLFDRIMGVKTAYAANSPFSVTVKTNSSGVATFSNLPLGSYRFTINADNATMESRQLDVQANSTSSATVMVPISGGNIAATVKDANGMLLSGVTVNVISGNTTKDTKTTDTSGVVNFVGLAAGEYTLAVTLSGYGTNSASVTVTEGKAAYQEIVLNGLTGSAAVTVSDGVKPVRAMVSAMRNGMIFDSIMTDASGVATFTNLFVGDYTFSAAVAGYTSNDAAVVVSSGATATGTVTLSRQLNAGSAAITVKDGTISLEWTMVEARGNNGVVKMAYTSPLGTAVFSDLPEGAYTFEVNRRGYDKNSISNIVVSNGKVATGTIALTKWKVGKASIQVSDGSKPLRSVMVTATRRQNMAIFRAMTDASGVAAFNDLPAGDYVFTTEAAGYAGNGVTAIVSSGATATGTVTLSRQLNAGSAAITVKDGTTPLEWTMVEARGNNGVVQMARVNPTGVAIFNDLPAGTYTFAVNMPGYEKNSISNIVINNGDIATGAIALTRWKVGNASIKVSDGAKLFSGAMVTAMRKQDRLVSNAMTDRSGVATFNNLPVGEYTFNAVAAGYTDSGVDLTVGSVSNEATASGTITLSKQTTAGSAVITVKDGTEPFHWGRVEARGNNGIVRMADVNPTGVAIFNDLPEGTYIFEANMPGYDKNSINNIAVSNGQVATGTIALSKLKVGNASIKVTDGANPLSGVTVTATRKQDGLTSNVMTDGAGVAIFVDLPEGEYTVNSMVAGYTGDSVTVTVSSGTAANATIMLSKQTTAGSAAITVKDGINPLGGVLVQAVDSKGGVRHAHTNAAGQAIFNNLPEGTYTFEVNIPGFDKNSISNIVVSNGQVAVGTIALTKWRVGNASIKVTDGANPLSGVVVTATRNGQVYDSMTDASGIATFNNLLEGEYTVNSEVAGYTGDSVTVTVSSGAVNATITLSKQTTAGSAAIAVKDGINSPFRWAIVQSVDSKGVVRQAYINAAGQAIFNNLPEGTYTFEVNIPGFDKNSISNIVVSNGKVATGTIYLTKI